MKTKKLGVMLIGVAVLALAAAPAISQGIYLDHVDGLENEYIPEGGTLTFHMRITGDATNHLMLNNGFTFSSNGLTWGDLQGELNPAYQWDMWFDFIKVINYWKTGTGADTVGVGLLSLLGTGLPADFDDIAFTFTVGPIQGPDGATLTLDSSWYPPSNPWMWDVVGENVAWGGPYEFRYGGCFPCEPYTYCTPQPTILKDIESLLEVHIWHLDVYDIDMESILVQGKIPPYDGYPIISGDEIITACFIMRFLGSSGFRPITGDFEATYTVDFDYLSGAHQQLVGDFSLQVYPGDVTFDGEATIDDLVFLSDYFWGGGDVCALKGEKVPELMDIDKDGSTDPRDVIALRNILGI